MSEKKDLEYSIDTIIIVIFMLGITYWISQIILGY